MLLFKKLNLKHFHSFFFAPKQAFTLVELIVVISVLAILATIAFTQISNVTLSARNSTRMTNLQSISSSLNLYIATNGVYPIPDNKTDILYSGSIIGYQGYIKDTAARILKLSPTASQDPLNTSSYFSYATNASRTDAQILGFLEANTTSFKALPATFASDELSTKTPYSKGEELGMLYTSGTTTPLSGTGIDVSTTASAYTAYYNSSDSLSGTGNALQNLLISYSYGAGYGSPAVDSCPTGFIPVPWNKDFNQPGFCVAKYEMKQAVGDAGSYTYSGGIWVPSWNQISPYCSNTFQCNSNSIRNFNWAIISKAEGYPLAWLNQYQAIEACKSLWAGYHLTTNNEWMAIARNIEQVSANWSTNQVGSGYIYRGHSDDLPRNALSATTNDSDGYIYTWNSSGNQKRTLILSNNQVIWDFVGNVWDHVNKANTIDGRNYFSGSTMLTSNACGGTGWYSFYGNDWVAACPFLNGYIHSSVWPFIWTLNALNGIGQILSYDSISSNIFLRWWYRGAGISSGIFSLQLNQSVTSGWGESIGFRCAK